MKNPLLHACATVLVAGSLLYSTPSISKNIDHSHQAERIEVAFVLDTTGSMANLIEGAKRKIWSIANTIVDINPNADIRMALVAYRDYGDDYVVRSYEMSSDIQGLYGDLLRFRAEGGGDSPEAVNEALDATVQDIDWTFQGDTKRIMFLVGDAPPHMDYANGPKYPQVMKEARRHDIVVHTVQAGHSRKTRRYWQEIAYLGGGNYISIPQDGGQIAHIDTPYDDQILELQRQLDNSIIPYGQRTRQEKIKRKLRERAASEPETKLDSAKFYSKRASKKEVITGGGDIIADIQNNAIELSDIVEAELPKAMQGLDEDGRKDFIEKNLATRTALEKEMAELVKKHDAYIKNETKNRKKVNSFDVEVSEALKKSF